MQHLKLLIFDPQCIFCFKEYVVIDKVELFYLALLTFQYVHHSLFCLKNAHIYSLLIGILCDKSLQL